MDEDLTLDLWTFDAGIEAGSMAAYAEAIMRRIEQSWDSGADLVLLPEFVWMGLESLLPKDGSPPLHAVAHAVWRQLLPQLQQRLNRAGKAVVLGTAPYLDPATGLLHNRAPMIIEGKLLHQDKLHLTPWEKDFIPGESLQLWNFRGFRIGVIICLDIEVPEIPTRLRNCGVDLLLCPSATETVLGVERVDRCASARAVELGCYVGVAHLLGRVKSELVDENVGRAAIYKPSQMAFAKEPRWTETEILESGGHRLRTVLSLRALKVTRRLRAETNPALLGKDAAGMNREIQILEDESQSP